MKKLLLFLIAFALTLCGCGSGRPAPTEGEMTFTDDLGNELCISCPQRVVCLTGSFADIWVLAGGRDTLVGATEVAWTSFGLELGEQTVNIGSAKQPDLEALIACGPDLVLASCGTDRNVELEDFFTRAGIPVAYFSVNSFEDYLRMLKICTELTGKPENYERWGTAVAREVETALARPDGSRPRVLCIRATGSSCRVKGSEGSVLGEMLCELDCENIADGNPMLEQLSMEAILQEDPDYIFAVLQGADTADARASLERQLLAHPAWASLTAVRQGRFYILDGNLYNLKPNEQWGLAYEQLADILYGEE